MGRIHSRHGVWALALMTSFLVIGGNAYADTKARVHAAGQYFHNDPNNSVGGFSDRINFGLEGKCPAPNAMCTSNGNFEYHNQFTHFHAHGKVTSLSVNSQPSAECMAIFSGPPGSPPGSGLGIDMTGKPSAVAEGSCKDGSCTSFHIEVIDGDDNAPNQGDWVCVLRITRGIDAMGNPIMTPESDSAEQLIRGDVEVKTTSQH